jgi:hypothetical protein
MSNPLPKPNEPYPTWAAFLKDVWMHGMSVQNMDKAIAAKHVGDAAESILEVFTRRNEARTVRPSSFLACARQTYYSVQGEDAGLMPDNIGSTFAVGHLLHELSYAAVESAIPECFKVEVEKPVELPGWWPKDHDGFNKRGHVDMFITGDASEDYLSPEEPYKMLIDFKTMGGFSYKKHSKTVWGEDPDAFGYLAQLAVYADALGLLPEEGKAAGAIIAGINRDSLTMPLFPRYIDPKTLNDELARVKLAVQMAVDGNDPGEEFLTRHGSDAHFQCGRSGKRGYCAFKQVCKDNPTRDGE